MPLPTRKITPQSARGSSRSGSSYRVACASIFRDAITFSNFASAALKAGLRLRNSQAQSRRDSSIIAAAASAMRIATSSTGRAKICGRLSSPYLQTAVAERDDLGASDTPHDSTCRALARNLPSVRRCAPAIWSRRALRGIIRALGFG